MSDYSSTIPRNKTKPTLSPEERAAIVLSYIGELDDDDD